MERGVVVGGVMLGVSLLLALVFNINAAREPMTEASQQVVPQPVAPRNEVGAEHVQTDLPEQPSEAAALEE